MGRIGFHDQEYMRGLDLGFNLIGHIAPSGNGQPAAKVPTQVKTPTQLFKEAAFKRKQGDIPLATTHVRALWDNIVEGQEKGWWTPWVRMSELDGDYASHVYFGKDEGDKVRGILAPDNDVAALLEKITPLGIDGSVSLLRYATMMNTSRQQNFSKKIGNQGPSSSL